jgi:molybdate transport system regulatory protein
MPTLSLRILLDDTAPLGPGKVELLDRIRATGSIARAARDMGMSYRRAWLLVEELNSSFREPVVAARPGGRGGGGAMLTATGEALLQDYRLIEQSALAAAAEPLSRLQAASRPNAAAQLRHRRGGSEGDPGGADPGRGDPDRGDPDSRAAPD